MSLRWRCGLPQPSEGSLQQHSARTAAERLHGAELKLLLSQQAKSLLFPTFLFSYFLLPLRLRLERLNLFTGFV